MFDDPTVSKYATLAALGVIAIVGLAVLAVLAVGLFQARSLVRREFTTYFISPIAFVVLVVFLLVTGHLFAVTFNLLTTTGPKGSEWPMQTMFADERFWLVFLFIPPLLTMRLFAEERGSGTLEMLLTAPVRDWQVVAAKYVACLAFYVIMWLPTLVYLPALLGASRPVWPSDWTDALTPWSVLFLAGLGAVVVGLFLLWLRLGTRGRLVSVILTLGGVAAAVTGGVLHSRRDAVKLVEVSFAIDPYPV